MCNIGCGCYHQGTWRDIIIIIMEVEATTCVYQKNHSGRTIVAPAPILAGFMVWNTTSMETMPVSSQQLIPAVVSYIWTQFPVPSATYHRDLLQWWCRPVPTVQSDGHTSTPDTSCPSIHIQEAQLVMPLATSVLTRSSRDRNGRCQPEKFVDSCCESRLWRSAMLQIYSRIGIGLYCLQQVTFSWLPTAFTFLLPSVP